MGWIWIFDTTTVIAFGPSGLDEAEYRCVGYAVRPGVVVAHEEGSHLIGTFPKEPRNA
jgi:hypothetical protein